MNEMTMRCECHSSDHTILVDYDHEQRELYLAIHLSQSKNFWGRLVHAVKYVFGYTSRYGAWDEVILRQQDCAQLVTLLQKRVEFPSKFVQDFLDDLDAQKDSP